MLINRPLSLVLCLTAVLALGACQEQLQGGNACPSLCPEQQLGFQDTVFEASEVIDTAATLPGVPSIGTEPQLLVARYAQNGDSVVSYAVFRFDTVISQVPQSDTLTPRPFTSVDSAYLNLYILPPPTGLDSFYIQDTVTFVVYDVYVNAPDLDTAQVHARFTGTPVGTRTMTTDSVKLMIAANAQLKIALDTAFLSHQVTTAHKVWLGVMVTSHKNARVVLGSVEGALASNGKPGTLGYVGHADTSKVAVEMVPQAKATGYGPAIPALGDYQMNVMGAPPVPAGMLAVGGLPSNRTLIRFKFPAWLVDSSTTVVRADLELYQAPFTAFQADSDSVFMQPLVTVAGPATTDLSKIGILLLDPATALTLHTAIRESKLPPAQAVLDTINLVRTTAVSALPMNVFSFWRVKGSAIQRAIVLTLSGSGLVLQYGEGVEPRQLLFYGPSAAPALRPRVHVSYVPHSTIGLP